MFGFSFCQLMASRRTAEGEKKQKIHRGRGEGGGGGRINKLEKERGKKRDHHKEEAAQNGAVTVNVGPVTA